MRQSHSVGQFIFILFFLTFSILSIITVQYIIEHDSIFFKLRGALVASQKRRTMGTFKGFKRIFLSVGSHLAWRNRPDRFDCKVDRYFHSSPMNFNIGNAIMRSALVKRMIDFCPDSIDFPSVHRWMQSCIFWVFFSSVCERSIAFPASVIQ